MDPIQINVFRGSEIENFHLAHAIVVDYQNNVLHQWGEDLMIYPRSAVKALQILPLLETNALEKFHLSDEDLALGASSHSGEKTQIERVQNWLKKIGLNENDLLCGPHAPFCDKNATRFGSIHNNCSGKHSAQLTMALMGGHEIKNYTETNHPVQIKIRETMEIMLKTTLNQGAIDGCSIPTYRMPLSKLAFSMACLAEPSTLPTTLKKPSERIFSAICKNSYWLAGRGRYCTEVTNLLSEKGFVKIGAEGVMVASLRPGLGIALKVQDGNSQASEVALSEVLFRLDFLKSNLMGVWREKPLFNWNQFPVGFITCKDFFEIPKNNL